MSILDHKITPEQLDQYGVVASPDMLMGTAQENKAVFDRLVKQIVTGAVNAAIDELAMLETTNEEWSEAEAGRAAEEAGRAAAEGARGAAEHGRDVYEQQRRRDESGRQISEVNREGQEKNRIDAEAGRRAAEAARADAEGARSDAESSRVLAEGAREAHLTDKANPHEVTAEQTGALPLTGGTLDGNLKLDVLDANAANAMFVRASTYVAVGDDQSGAVMLGGDSDAPSVIRFGHPINNMEVPTVLRHVAGPIQKMDAANKEYVDAAAQAVQGNLQTHTGDKSNPHGVTAAQVGALPTGGGTMDGQVDMNGHGISRVSQIVFSMRGIHENGAGDIELVNERSPGTPVCLTNVMTPAGDTDAANKGYVDGAIAAADHSVPIHISFKNSDGSIFSVQNSVGYVWKEMRADTVYLQTFAIFDAGTMVTEIALNLNRDVLYAQASNLKVMTEFNNSYGIAHGLASFTATNNGSIMTLHLSSSGVYASAMYICGCITGLPGSAR